MRDYELTLVMRPQLEEEAQAALLDKVKGWITADGGRVVRVDRWGRRRLAYPIKKEREAQYIFMLTQLEATQVPKLERNIRLSEEILRHLFVYIEPQEETQPAPETETAG